MAKNGRSRWGRRFAVLAVLLAGAGGALWRFHRHDADEPKYSTEKVEIGDLTQTVTATGTLNAVMTVTVGSQVSGRICKLYVDFNSMVKSNQVIAEIDPSTYQAALEQTRADLANAKANAELQRAQAKRSTELFTNRLISEADYENAVAMWHEADATVQIKEASLHNAEANLGYCKIFSPVDGVVISRAVELGQTVASSFSTPTLFQIANDLTRMQIDTAVDEADIGGVKEGESVDFTVAAYPNRTFHGVITQVRNAPTTVNNVVTYDTVIGVTNLDYSLKPGMTASVSIVVARRSHVLEIPNAALRFQPSDPNMAGTNTFATSSGQKADREPGRRPPDPKGRQGGGGEGSSVRTVFLLAGDRADADPRLEAVQVRTGITDNIHTEVLSRLKEGDLVVTGLAIPSLTHDQAVRNPFSLRRRL